MSDSGYFNGTFFRAIDNDCALDNHPLSSLVEGSIANNHQHLHREGGGAVTRHMGASGANSQYGNNFTSQVSLIESSIFMMPFLVTRGLKSVEVTWHGTINFEVEDIGVDARLELVGFGSSIPVQWQTNDVGANNLYTIVLDLDMPATVETETFLILWQKGNISTDSTTFSLSESAGGDVSIREQALNVVTANHFRAFSLYNWILTLTGAVLTDRISSYELMARFRVPNGGGGNHQTARLVPTPSWANLMFLETRIGGMTSRSVIIKSESI